jgi:hypothetical protein
MKNLYVGFFFPLFLSSCDDVIKLAIIKNNI